MPVTIVLIRPNFNDNHFHQPSTHPCPRLYIPKGNRCCAAHMIKKRFFTDEFELLRPYSNFSFIEGSEVTLFLNQLANNVDSSWHNNIGNFSLSEERLKTFTVLNWENIIKLQEMFTSTRNSESRSIIQALVVFLFKLRSGSSNKMIQEILGLEREQQVSDYFHQTMHSKQTFCLPTLDSMQNLGKI